MILAISGMQGLVHSFDALAINFANSALSMFSKTRSGYSTTQHEVAWSKMLFKVSLEKDVISPRNVGAQTKQAKKVGGFQLFLLNTEV